MPSKDDILELADHLAISPMTVAMHSLNMLEESIGGELDIVDPTSPFIGLLEMASTQTAAAMVRFDTGIRKQNPKLATSMSELYCHMSDDDYAGISATPIRNRIISIAFKLSEFKEAATYDSSTGNYTMSLPKDTVFANSCCSWMYLQPINITLFDSGAPVAVFDDSVEETLSIRTSNVIDSRIGQYDQYDYLIMDIPCDQLEITTNSGSVTSGNKWSVDVEYSNDFHHAKGYYSTDGDTWTEMHTTYDADSYDPNEVTMIIEVDDGTVTGYIPDVFVDEGLAGIEARLDVYATQGAGSHDTSSLSTDDWTITWSDYGNLTPDYLTPIQDISTYLIYSTGLSEGGMDAKSFNEVKESVVYNLYGKGVAMTGDELIEFIEGRGYKCSLRKDNITDRVYVASKSIGSDVPEELDLVSGIAAINEPITIDTAGTDYSNNLIVNEDRSTLKPSSLFKISDGTAYLLNDSEQTEFNGLSSSDKVTELNSERYLYTPFHIVLDNSLSVFIARAYWLTEPELSYRNAKAINTSLGFTTETEDVTLELDDETYILTITSSAPSGLSALKAQLVYTDSDSNVYYATVDGTMGTDSFTFEFEFETTLDINSSHEIDIVFNSDDGETIRVGLTDTFSLVYVSESHSYSSSFDSILDTSEFGDTFAAITYDELCLNFGYYMENLHLSARTLLKDAEYLTYTSNVVATYEENIYAVDSDGNKTYTIDDDGVVSFDLLHAAGDTMYDSDGNEIYLYEIGDYVMDGDTDEPTVINDISTEHEARLPLFDYRFKLLTSDAGVEYYESIPESIYSVLTSDIEPLQGKLLGLTSLYFEPLSDCQYASVELSDNEETTIYTAFSFEVAYQLTKTGYEDSDYRTLLTARTKEVILEHLQTGSYSHSGLTSLLDTLGGDKLLAVTVSNPLEDYGAVSATLTNDLASFSIDKVIRLETSGRFAIDDDVTINYSK